MNVRKKFKDAKAVQWDTKTVPIVGIDGDENCWWLEVELHNDVHSIHHRLIERWFEDEDKIFEPIS